nr:DUF2752 domain-containing protein [uncultured Carboxylicivirga sp.]
MKKENKINDWKIFQFFLIIGLSLGLLYPLVSYRSITEIHCPFNHLNANPCPSCGLSRAWYLLYNGHFEDALEANSNAYSLLMLLIIQIIWRGWIIIKATEGKNIIVWDIIVTLSSIALLAGNYLKDLLHFMSYH